ncbi:S-adenosylmethionine decarboxylase [Testicularia cyperi]|uniref:S-adenosylmethionine decarboxylase n=1 Tax=Testicularia cyperi TaxID=1882483 RepID=A0A317XTD9_9BASI|nr:S-adenosylmethionine decarboxylase [Testicularia cyperi]
MAALFFGTCLWFCTLACAFLISSGSPFFVILVAGKGARTLIANSTSHSKFESLLLLPPLHTSSFRYRVLNRIVQVELSGQVFSTKLARNLAPESSSACQTIAPAEVRFRQRPHLPRLVSSLLQTHSRYPLAPRKGARSPTVLVEFQLSLSTPASHVPASLSEMTPAIDLEATADRLESFSTNYTKQHHYPPHHHQDTADLLMEAKEAQRLNSIEIMDAREQLLKSKSLLQHETDTSSITTAVDSNNSVAEKATQDFHDPCGPFEGPEKLLELWFAEEPADVASCAWDDVDARPGHFGLRSVPKAVWETMLDVVKCKVLSVIDGTHVDAYLLSESSMFVFPHKLILKTCGTTTLLLGLQKLLVIANRALANLPRTSAKIVSTANSSPGGADDDATLMSDSSLVLERQLGSLVKYAFYSRKSFMFPERQKGPHRDWMLEVAVLDRFFDYGSAYTVGKMNGDHWLLWMGCEGAREADAGSLPSSPSATMGANVEVAAASLAAPAAAQDSAAIVERPLSLPAPCVEDQTLEILMTHLSPASCGRFVFDEDLPQPTMAECYPSHAGSADAASPCTKLDKGHALGLALSNKLGLTDLFPSTELDAFAFEPCGYSANAVMPRGGKNDRAGYWTIHVTPEEGSSYASFETNVALCSSSASSTAGSGGVESGSLAVPSSLPSLVSRVVDIFEPAKMSVTLFVSTTEDTDTDSNNNKALTNEDILHALSLAGYRRTDRIAYEFERYNLVFVSFELRRPGPAYSAS